MNNNNTQIQLFTKTTNTLFTTLIYSPLFHHHHIFYPFSLINFNSLTQINSPNYEFMSLKSLILTKFPSQSQ